MSFTPVKRQRVRHFHFGFGYSAADPAEMIQIVETSSERDADGKPIGQIWCTGWRPKLVRWVIKKLLPLPTIPPKEWNGRRFV